MRAFQELAKLWRQASDLRKFVDAVRTEAIRREEAIDSSTEVGRWLEWAERQLVELNPISEKWKLPALDGHRPRHTW